MAGPTTKTTKKAPTKKKDDTSLFSKLVKMVNTDKKIVGREPEGIALQRKREKEAGI